jgi:Mg2+/citrate symporter
MSFLGELLHTVIKYVHIHYFRKSDIFILFAIFFFNFPTNAGAYDPQITFELSD